jgi:hypothetical protein
MMQIHFRSDAITVFIVKYWASLIWVAVALGVFTADFPTWRSVFTIVPVLFAAFHASLAVVEVRDGVIRYRRLYKWNEISPSEVLAAKIVWPPFIGRIKLKNVVFPWGKLYFVLDKNTQSNPFRRGEFPLVIYLNGHKLHGDEQRSAMPLGSNFASLRLLLASGIGILACLMILYLSPSDLLHGSLSKTSENMPVLLKIQFQIVEWLHKSVVQFGALAGMAFLAVRRRDRAEAWLYAFLSGFALAFLVSRLLF